MTGGGAAVRMEWTKLRTVPSTAWSLLALVTLMVAASALLLWTLGGAACGTGCDPDLPRLSLGGIYLAQLPVVVLSVLAVTAEYETMMIRTTLAAQPRRLTLLGAKAAVVSAAVLVAGLVGVLGAWTVGRSVRVGGYPPVSPADAATGRAYLGTVVYLGLVALLSLGVGALVRHTAGAVTTVIGLLYVAPIVGQVITDERWRSRVERYAPMSAGLSVQATRHLERLAVAPWRGVGVLAVYAVVALLLGAVVFRVRDA